MATIDDSSTSPSTPLRLASWNVLADGLAQTGAFASCPAEALTWEHRAPQILAMVDTLKPDILCMPETSHVDELAAHWHGQLEHVFVPKREQAVPGFTLNGLSLWWNPAVLQPLSTTTMAYMEPDGSTISNQNAIVVAFQLVAQPDAVLIVAGTHWKAKPVGAPKRAAAALQVLQQLAAQQDIWAVAGKRVACVLMGDLNAEPSEESVEALQTSSACTLHSAHVRVHGTWPTWTTWKSRRSASDGTVSTHKRCIDYVFCSPHLRVVGVEDCPSDEAVGAAGLPHAEFPSDHRPVYADVCF